MNCSIDLVQHNTILYAIPVQNLESDAPYWESLVTSLKLDQNMTFWGFKLSVDLCPGLEGILEQKRMRLDFFLSRRGWAAFRKTSSDLPTATSEDIGCIEVSPYQQGMKRTRKQIPTSNEPRRIPHFQHLLFIPR